MHVGFVYAKYHLPLDMGVLGGGREEKRREIEYFKPLPLICRVSTSLLCVETLRSKGCTQLSWSQITEPGQLHSSPSIFYTLLPLPSHRYHPQPTTSGLSASWQGTEVERRDPRVTGSALCCHSSQDNLRDTNTCLPPDCAVMLLRACRTITPIPWEAHSDSQQHWLHTLQASKPEAGYWGQGKEYWTTCPETIWAVQNSNSSLVGQDPGKHGSSGISTHCSNRSQPHAGRTPMSTPSLWLLQLALLKINFEML